MTSAWIASIAAEAAVEPIVCSQPLPQELFNEIPASTYDPNLWLYRERTIALLKRYVRMSIEVGRLPSLLGRELFRAKVSSYRVGTFEDAVIFVHDVERNLDQLEEFDQQLIATIVLQDHTRDEACARLRCGRRTIGRRFPEVLDHLSELFLRGGLLRPLPVVESREIPFEEKPCQEGETTEFPVSDCSDSENNF
jgi:hypothetical protein